MLTNKDVLTALKIKVAEVEDRTITNTKHKAMTKLQLAGMEVITEGSNSSQGYVTVKNPKTDRELVISKDLGGRTRLYSGHRAVAYNDKPFNETISKIDLINMLNTPVKPQKGYEFTEVEKFRRLKEEKAYQEEQLDKLVKRIEEAQRKKIDHFDKLRKIDEELEKLKD